MVASEVSTKEKLDGIYAYSWEKRQDTYVLTPRAQVVLRKSIRRTDQDWFKNLAAYKSFNAYSWEYQTNFGGSSADRYSLSACDVEV